MKDSFSPEEAAQIAASPQIQEALSKLNDIAIPEAVSWWPLATGVWAVIVGVLGITIGLIWYYWVRYQNNRYRREAEKALQESLQNKTLIADKVLTVNQLLKQVAITHYGRSKVAHLSGENWVHFLQETALYIKQPEALLHTLQLGYLPSQSQQTSSENPSHQVELDEFIAYSQAWIKGHHK